MRGSIRPRPVHWLWAGRIALGTVGLLAGREGVGKSTIAIALAAWVTKGTMPGVYEGHPRPVVVAATEDSWEHTLVPRLIAAGADRDLLYRVDTVSAEGLASPIVLPADLPALDKHLSQMGAAMLLLDPLLHWARPEPPPLELARPAAPGLGTDRPPPIPRR